jgi:hypothetical protein
MVKNVSLNNASPPPSWLVHVRLLRRLLAPIFACLLSPAVLGITSLSAEAATLEWTRQMGTSESDSGWGVSTDRQGNVYMSGSTSGSLAGPNAGEFDAFLFKYNSSGNLLWSRQLGSTTTEGRNRVSADGLGNVYISGRTGNLAGSVGPYLAKYDDSGSLLWTRQLGESATSDGAVAADDMGNVYISGYDVVSNAAFLAKYNEAGDLVWTRWTSPVGTSSDRSSAISVDGSGNAYIAGMTWGNLGGPSAGLFDAFVRKYDADGNVSWTRQFGTARSDFATGVSADGFGNVYVSANLFDYVADEVDMFLRKYDVDGNLLWSRELITGGGGHWTDVSSDSLGNVYLTGATVHSIPGPNTRELDAFVSKYDGSGNVLWTSQFGSESFDGPRGVSADGLGNVYISGTTQGNLGGTHAGGVNDAFVAKLSESVPEPSTAAILVLAAAGLTFWRRPSSRNRCAYLNV